MGVNLPLVAASEVGGGSSSDVMMRNEALLKQLAELSEKMASCVEECKGMSGVAASAASLKQTHDRLKHSMSDFTESCQRLEQEAQILADIPITEAPGEAYVPKDTITEAARMDSHRLKGQHYELLEENLPKVIAGLKTAKLLAQVLAGNSDGETPLIWVAAKVLQNRKLKELTPEIEEVGETLELVQNALIIFRSTAKVVLESCAEHLPHLVKGVTALAEYVIDAYTLEGVRSMVGHEDDEEVNRERLLPDQGMPGSPKQPKTETFTDKSIFRMGNTITQKVFHCLDKNSKVNLTEEKLIVTLRGAMMKDIASVGFGTLKDTSLDISVVEKEILGMCTTQEQGVRLSLFISNFSVAVSKTVDKIAEKMKGKISVWNQRDFIPQIVSECAAFFLFSDISSIGLKWSDFILKYDPSSVQRKRHHYEVVYQFFNIAHLTLKKALDEIQEETQESKLLDLNDTIPMQPSIISATLLDMAQRCTSASRVINALRYKNSSRAFVTLRIALNEEDERNFVSEQVDVGVTNLVKVSQDLSQNFKYCGNVAANVVSHLIDPSTFRAALQEILSEVIEFVTLRKDSEEEEIKSTEMEKRLADLHLNLNFLNLLTSMAGTRAATSWFSWSLGMLNIMKHEARTISGSALSFLIPGTYLMVGKGAKLVKPTSVRRMGAKLIVGPLFDVQVKSNNYNYKIGKVETYVEKIREIQQHILDLGAKVYAAESASRQIEQSSSKSHDKQLAITGGNAITIHTPGQVGVVSRVSLFTAEDRQAILQGIPARLARELNDKTLTFDYEVARKKLLAAHNKRQREKGSSDKWEEDPEFVKIVDPLYYECFLLSAVLVMKKEDLEVRLEALRKTLVDSNHQPGKDAFHFSEDSLLMS
uniref:Uncharacterized protein n=1 Tax=Paramoeba aestuarina TaxID=180227 RepID=A0A7S4KPY0_9EUKA|mmetsp:Transcript_22605/g.35160  ORF Transcript_22605/g.35160 Transcript_22605/m.35160 type:complete len:876 (+) Transcript_22605:235-2862(+)